MTAKLIDSRKGYVARIPEEAVLDSSASGWSPAGMFERRVYRIKGTGVIRFTATVKPAEIPQNATSSGGYTLLESDSTTSSGTAKVRVYYQPTRTVRIELIPAGAGMQRYLDAYQTIFGSFRWKPGAASDLLDIP